MSNAGKSGQPRSRGQAERCMNEQGGRNKIPRLSKLSPTVFLMDVVGNEPMKLVFFFLLNCTGTPGDFFPP